MIRKIKKQIGKIQLLPPSAKLLQLNILVAVAGLLTSIVLARALGPSERGSLAALTLWPTALANIGLAGIHLYLSRRVAQEPLAAVHWYSVALRSVAILSSITIATLFLIAQLPNLATTFEWPALLIAGLVIPFSMWNTVQTQLELSRNNIANLTIIRGAFALIYLLSVASLWFFNQVLAVSYFCGFLVAVLLSPIISGWFISKSLPRPDPSVGDALPNALKVIRSSAPDGISVGLVSLASIADRLMVSLFFNNSAMGIYIVAFSLAQFQNLISEAMAPLFFSRVAKFKDLMSVDKDWLAMRLRQSVMINALTAMFVVIASPVLLPLMFGDEFSDALLLVQLLVPALMFRTMMRPFEEVLKAAGKALRQSYAVGSMTAVFATIAIAAVVYERIEFVVVGMILAGLTGFSLVVRSVSSLTSINLPDLLVFRWGDAVKLMRELSRVGQN